MGISIKDLRIGNYVIHDNKILQCNGAFISNLETGSLIEKTEPIPLTEDWLIDLGFEDNKIECNEYIMLVSVNGFSGTLTKDSSWFISIIYVSAGQTITVVKQYVHQLQNLYFAFTEKELTK